MTLSLALDGREIPISFDRRMATDNDFGPGVLVRTEPTFPAQWSIVVRIQVDLDTGKFSQDPHTLDVRWEQTDGPGGRKRLYFAPVLDASAVAWESESILWVGTLSQGVMKLDLGKDLESPADDSVERYFPDLPPGGTVMALHKSSSGDLWIGYGLSWGGIAVIGKGKMRSDTGPWLVLDFADISPELVGFVGLNQGIVAKDSNLNTRWKFYKRADPLPDNDTSGLDVDPKGHIWATTFDLSSPVLFSSADPDVDGVAVLKLNESRDAAKWVTNFGVQDGLRSDYLLGVSHDQAGRIWFQTRAGIEVLDYGSDPEDKSDDRWERIGPGMAQAVVHLPRGRAMVSTAAVYVEDVDGNPRLSQENALWLLQYTDLLSKDASTRITPIKELIGRSGDAAMSEAGVAAIAPCSGKNTECYFGNDEGKALDGVVRFSENSDSGVLFQIFPCQGISFVRIESGDAGGDSAQVWHLLRSSSLDCGQVFLPAP
ncbi:MAG: hypothetical protein HYT87_18325 [Nitrospirae bacterium]|nr:hypothetical protein [Nitrospirota bacterium]